MDLEKILFLISLTMDEDLPSNIDYKDILDFDNNEDEQVLIIKKQNELTSKKDFIKYTIQRKENIVKINKEFNDRKVSYMIDFRKISTRDWHAQLHVNKFKKAMYTFNKDVLNAEIVDKSDVLYVGIVPDNEENYATQTGRKR